MLKFETTECSRCFGTGRYGPSAVEGGICFKCRGKRVIMTVAAAKLAAALEAAATVTTAELVPGTKVYQHGIPGFIAAGWDTVVSVGPDPLNEGRVIVTLRTKNGKEHTANVFPTSTWRTAWTTEQKQSFLSGIAYVGKRLRKGLVIVEDVATEGVA